MDETPKKVGRFDGLLKLRGTWQGGDADEYVRQIREDWGERDAMLAEAFGGPYPAHNGDEKPEPAE